MLVINPNPKRGVRMLVTTPDIHTGAHYGQKFWFLVLERVYRNFHLRFLPRFSSMELDEGKDEI